MVMPWLSEVKGLVNGYLGGQASGDAIAQIISGKVNPSGKLAETYPLSLEDTPCNKYYPATKITAEHTEGIYIGYRYYDTAEKEVLFPFGYGLSYTQFEYSDLKLSSKKIKDSDILTVSYKIKNIGECDGAEISQVYVRDKESTIFRPQKELRGFKKVFLKAGEETTVTIELGKRAFAFYNAAESIWQVESGDFEIMVGASSRDVKLSADVFVESTDSVAVPDYRESAPSYYTADVKAVPDKEYQAILGRPIPAREYTAGNKLTIVSSLSDAADKKWGRKINSVFDSAVDLVIKNDKVTGNMVKSMIVDIPIRNFVTMSSGAFTEDMAEVLLMILNEEKAGKGLTKILAGLAGAIRKIPELLKSI